MQKYLKFRYMFPPRPEYIISSDQLHKYEGTHVAQPKLNGSCCTIFIKGDELRQFGRHQNENLSNFKINQDDLKVLNCDNDEWNVVVGEYMNKNKNGVDGKPWNHKFVIFDILVYNGEYLVGTTIEERITLLDKLFGTIDENDYLYKINESVFRVKTFTEDFLAKWKDITLIDMLEGFVLKKLGAKLVKGIAEKNNMLWQNKCRKSTKNYRN